MEASEQAAVSVERLIDAPSEAALLDRLVTEAKSLTGSAFSVALFLGTDGQPSLMSHQGMSADQVARLPHLPRPIGLVGVVLEGEALRLASAADHPRAIGLPPTHAAMGPILALPMFVDGDVLGAIYLAREVDGHLYDEADQELVRSLSDSTAALVRRMRRQAAADLLIARMRRPRSTDANVEADLSDDYFGDSITVRRLLSAARDILGTDMAFVSSIVDGTETLAYVHANEDAPDLREGSHFDASEGYCALMLEGEIPGSVPDLNANPLTAALDITDNLDLGSYCGTPIRLPDGTTFGTLCGLSKAASKPLSPAQMYSLRAIADLIGTELAVKRENDAQHAAEREAFRERLASDHRQIYLQPIVDLTTGRPTGYEALSRFTDPWGNFRRPDLEFLEATKLGFGDALEHEMLRVALGHLDRIPHDQYLSVNLSPDALLSPVAFDILTGALAERPSSIVLELTEHAEITDYAALMRTLAGLRERGLRLAIDDTGAGYSSLQHVVTMQPDIVKLDAAFVRDIHTNASHRAVARAMSSLALDMNASLVAEGIETQDELDVLMTLGASHGQGYLLGRPAPVDQLLGPAHHAATH